MSGNIPNYDLRKKLIKRGLITDIFDIQINIDCKKCYLAVILVFIQFKPMYKTKSFQNAPTYNQFHNILRLFDVLPNFPFTTSETIVHYYL